MNTSDYLKYIRGKLTPGEAKELISRSLRSTSRISSYQPFQPSSESPLDKIPTPGSSQNRVIHRFYGVTENIGPRSNGIRTASLASAILFTFFFVTYFIIFRFNNFSSSEYYNYALLYWLGSLFFIGLFCLVTFHQAYSRQLPTPNATFSYDSFGDLMVTIAGELPYISTRSGLRRALGVVDITSEGLSISFSIAWKRIVSIEQIGPQEFVIHKKNFLGLLGRFLKIDILPLRFSSVEDAALFLDISSSFGHITNVVKVPY
jgi:hypothetical protein